MNPIGKTITVDGHELEVIGTMIRPAASFFGDQDMRILIPYWMMQKMYPNARENAIVVTAKDGQLPKALDEVRTILRIDRRVPYDKPDNFALSTADQMVADFRQITAMTFLVMAVLSSIGLLVGGIGVMNIMLVFGDGADAGDRRAQSHRRAAARYHPAVPAGSVGVDQLGRHRRDSVRLGDFADQPVGVHVPAGGGADVGGGVGDCGVGECGAVLRDLAGV